LTFTNITSHEEYHISKKVTIFLLVVYQIVYLIESHTVFRLGTNAIIALASSGQLLSIDIDLWLWSCGVQNMALSHHRTLSIYY